MAVLLSAIFAVSFTSSDDLPLRIEPSPAAQPSMSIRYATGAARGFFYDKMLIFKKKHE
jgi:hypothetical protein